MTTNPTYTDPAQEWPKRSGGMSEEEFHELERLDPDVRYEYIQGRAYPVDGITVGHRRIRYNIVALLDRLLAECCNASSASVQVLLRDQQGDRKHYVYPDVTVSCSPEDSRPDTVLVESPKIVFEVLSPGTEKKDRGVKFRVYQNCPTIQEIALVSQFALHVEIWQRDAQDNTHWHVRSYDRGAIVDFNSIDVHVAIEELYQRLPSLLEEDEEDEA